jgi:hypothetical protein
LQSNRSTDAERRACEIRLRAERKAGQLLTKTIKRGGDPKSKSRDTTLILKENGISKDQSAQWQKLGALPQRDFDLAIGENVKPPTTSASTRGRPPLPRDRG